MAQKTNTKLFLKIAALNWKTFPLNSEISQKNICGGIFFVLVQAKAWKFDKLWLIHSYIYVFLQVSK